MPAPVAGPVDFLLFLLLFCSAFFYFVLQNTARVKTTPGIEESREKQKKIEAKIEGFPQGRAAPFPTRINGWEACAAAQP